MWRLPSVAGTAWYARCGAIAREPHGGGRAYGRFRNHK
jgi:hypothetical protein